MQDLSDDFAFFLVEVFLRGFKSEKYLCCESSKYPIRSARDRIRLVYVERDIEGPGSYTDRDGSGSSFGEDTHSVHSA